MLYKTIVHRLIQDRPEIQRELKRTRALRPALDRYAAELKAGHAAWTEQLRLTRPDANPMQLASEALEIAVRELEERLPGATYPDEMGPDLDAAMASILRSTPPA